ncbi:hypothetical protein QD460_22240 [Rhizobium jaguaris]|uniref:hypothetical protein n=1 Tax=Rhizobium jaguaris TaxID=1312183 RepID=UPI0039BF1711
MWTRPKIVVAALLLASVLPAQSFAGNPLLPKPYVRPVYPYKDLPGVIEPKMAADEKFECRTTTVRIRGFHEGIFFRNLPRLGYICEENGVISEGTSKPNYQYWQYNGPNR